MKTRQLGKTGLVLTELGMGGSAIGNLYRPTMREEAHAAIVSAWQSGVRYFDTSPSYGYGLSERRLGDALREFPRNSYVLSTKAGRLLVPDATPKSEDRFPGSLPFRVDYDYSYDGIMRSVEHSLQRIGTDFIDILYVDDVGKLQQQEQHSQWMKTLLDSGYRAISELREQKIVRAIGIGVHDWQESIAVLSQTDFDCFMLAGAYTLLEQDALEILFPLCEQRGISIIAASPYNSGVLANGQHYNYEMASHKILTRVNALQKICETYQVDLPHVALQFPLCHSQIVSVVTGARNEEQIALSVSYLKQKIPSRLWQALKEADLISMNAPI